MARSDLWTREQLIMALNVYFKIPFKDVKEKHPLIQKYAPLIGTTPTALKMKIGNFGRLDPTLKAKDKTTKVRMNRRETTYNALNVRGLQEITPPICGNNVNSKLLRTAKPSLALLHQAYASCGRVFSCLSLKGALCALVCLFALTFAACEKELIPSNQMYQFY